MQVLHTFQLSCEGGVLHTDFSNVSDMLCRSECGLRYSPEPCFLSCSHLVGCRNLQMVTGVLVRSSKGVKLRSEKHQDVL